MMPLFAELSESTNVEFGLIIAIGVIAIGLLGSAFTLVFAASRWMTSVNLKLEQLVQQVTLFLKSQAQHESLIDSHEKRISRLELGTFEKSNKE